METQINTTPIDAQPQLGLGRRMIRLALVITGILIAFIVLTAIGMAALWGTSVDDLQRFQDKLQSINAIFIGIRWAFLITIISCWKIICQWIAERRSWSDERYSRLLAQRWHLGIALLIVELFANLRITNWFL